MAVAAPSVGFISIDPDLKTTFTVKNNSTPAATYPYTRVVLTNTLPTGDSASAPFLSGNDYVFAGPIPNNTVSTKAEVPDGDPRSKFVPGRRGYLVGVSEVVPGSAYALLSKERPAFDVPALPPDAAVASAISYASALLTAELGRLRQWEDGTGSPRSDAQSVTFEVSTSAEFAPELTRTVAATRGSVYSTWATPVTGLTPGVKYYVRGRAAAPYGTTTWGPVASFTTSPAPAPTVSVIEQNGRLAISASSPFTTRFSVTGAGAVSGETSPILTAPLIPNTPYSIHVRGIVDNPAAPGETYYTEPAQVSYTLKAVNPPTPGSYFDGGFIDSSMTDYQWAGVANASASLAIGHAVKGWGAPASGVKAYQVESSGGETRRVRYLAISWLVPNQDVGAGVGLTGSAAQIDVAEAARYAASIEITSTSNWVPFRRYALSILWLNSSGSQIGSTSGPSVTAYNGMSTRLAATGQSPAGAAFAALRAIPVDDILPGDYFDLDKAILTLGRTAAYFDGNTPSTQQWVFAWLGTPNDSISTRSDAVDLNYDPLQDPDCPPVPAPPRPPSVPSECLDDVSIWRRYWYALPATEVSAFLATLPTMRIEAGGLGAEQVRIRVFENPDGLDPADFDADDSGGSGDAWISEQLVTHLPADTVLVLDSVRERALASVRGGEWLSADHLLYGPEGRPATWPVLRCGIPYLVAVDVPVDEPVGNISVSMSTSVRYG